MLERVAAGHALHDILTDIVRIIERPSSGMLCSVLLVDEARGAISHGAAPSLPAAYIEALDGLSIGPAVGSCGTAAFRKERVVVEDITTHPYWASYRQAAALSGMRACWSTPILSPDRRVIGTFAMYYREPRGPSSQELAWVDAATHLAAIAISNAHAIEALRRGEAQSRNLARIYAMSNAIDDAIAREHDPARLYELACRLAVDFQLARLAWVGVVNPANQHIVAVAHAGVAADYVSSIDLDLSDERMNRGPAGVALRRQQPAISHDIQRDETVFWKDAAREHRLGSVAVLPMRARGQATAILAIYAEHAHAFGDEAIAALSTLADDIAFAVDSARTRSALRASEQLRAMIYDCVADVVFCLAVRGAEHYRFESVNRAFSEHTGLTEGDVLGKRIEDVLPAASAARLQARCSEAVAHCHKLTWEETVRWPAGERCGEITVSPLIDASGRCTHVVGTVHDLTAHRRAEAERRDAEAKLHQAQRLQSLGTLAGGIAHDFNNILAAIHGNLDLTLDELHDHHPARETVHEVKRAAKRATDLVRQVLMFSRRTEARLERVDLRTVIEEVLVLLSPVLKHKVGVRTAFGPGVPAILGDSTQLHQVVMNLVTNAAHALGASDDGEITVGLDAAGGGARLTVSDNGCGMAPETLRRIYEPFFTTRRASDGTGLGLSVVHGIVKSHRGAIEVRSELGKGTTFELVFPTA
ncbi:MAG TPA: GAF domain-containing protein [Kofleriaceae bacterium]|nr:GAF domain-containing protein [Kofleriaceae bacterium]